MKKLAVELEAVEHRSIARQVELVANVAMGNVPWNARLWMVNTEPASQRRGG